MMGTQSGWGYAYYSAQFVIAYAPNSPVAGQAGASLSSPWYRCNVPLSSDHVGGAQILMGDGTVRFISNNINLDTLKYIAARNDNQVLGEF